VKGKSTVGKEILVSRLNLMKNPYNLFNLSLYYEKEYKSIRKSVKTRVEDRKPIKKGKSCVY